MILNSWKNVYYDDKQNIPSAIIKLESKTSFKDIPSAHTRTEFINIRMEIFMHNV